MKENVGRIDRGIRFVVGPALAAVGYSKLGGNEGRLAGLAAIVIGSAILDSAITRVCPMNRLLHIDTRTRRERARDAAAFVAAAPNPFIIPDDLVPDEEIASITTVTMG